MGRWPLGLLRRFLYSPSLSPTNWYPPSLFFFTFSFTHVFFFSFPTCAASSAWGLSDFLFFPGKGAFPWRILTFYDPQFSAVFGPRSPEAPARWRDNHFAQGTTFLPFPWTLFPTRGQWNFVQSFSSFKEIFFFAFLYQARRRWFSFFGPSRCQQPFLPFLDAFFRPSSVSFLFIFLTFSFRERE